MNTLPSSDEDPIFDDCPICLAEQQARKQHSPLTATQLRQAFEEAAKLPGVISGSLDPWPANYR